MRLVLQISILIITVNRKDCSIEKYARTRWTTPRLIVLSIVVYEDEEDRDLTPVSRYEAIDNCRSTYT